MDPLDRSVTEALRAWRVQHGAGVAVSDALSTSATVCALPAGRRCFEAAAQSVTRGEPIEQTMNVFKPLLSDGERAVLIAGWNSGRVEACMDGVIAQRELWLQARSKIRSGMVLPAAVLVIAAFVAPLPAFIASGNAFAYILSVAAPLIIAFLVWKFVSKTLATRSISLDRTLLDLPVVGRFERERSISEFTSLLSLLLSAGVNITQALKICAHSVLNGVYRDEIKRIEAAVSKGNPLSSAMKNLDLWPVEVLSALTVGEKSGSLDDVLARLGNSSRERYIAAVDALAAWLPKIAYGIVALFVIFQIAMLAASVAGMYQQ